MNEDRLLSSLRTFEHFTDDSLGFRYHSPNLSGFHYNRELLKAAVENMQMETVSNRSNSLYLAIENSSPSTIKNSIFSRISAISEPSGIKEMRLPMEIQALIRNPHMNMEIPGENPDVCPPESFFEERPEQTVAIARMLDELKTHRVVFLYAPTGSGKSLINLKVAMRQGSGYVTTPQTTLVDQYSADLNGKFANLGSAVMGRNNYHCLYAHSLMEATTREYISIPP